jgi:hypothetical protein
MYTYELKLLFTFLFSLFCVNHTDSVHFLLQNVKKKMYGCTEAFLADVKWILHNCIIYNGGRQPEADFVYTSLCFTVKELEFKTCHFFNPF